MKNPLLGFVNANQKTTHKEEDLKDRSTKKVKDREEASNPITDSHIWDNDSSHKEVEENEKVISYKYVVIRENVDYKKEDKDQSKEDEEIWEIERLEEDLRIEEKKYGSINVLKLYYLTYKKRELSNLGKWSHSQNVREKDWL
ncbi:unnamed protein product [Lathyrus sativus]|nr:unnamed protein product [Lathyrus sativus]